MSDKLLNDDQIFMRVVFRGGVSAQQGVFVFLLLKAVKVLNIFEGEGEQGQ
jgi:hypothetical protein